MVSQLKPAGDIDIGHGIARNPEIAREPRQRGDDQPDADEDQQYRAAEDHHQQDDDEHERQRIETVNDAHHRFVDSAADPAGGRAPGDADHQRNQRRGNRDHQGDPGAGGQPREAVPADFIGAEYMRAAKRRSTHRIPVDLVISPRQQEGQHQSQQYDRQDNHKRETGFQHRFTLPAFWDPASHRADRRTG